VARALDLVPADVEMLMLLGESLRRTFSFGQAVEVFRRARELKPDSGRILASLGAALYGTTRLTEAARTLEQAIAMDPDCAEAYASLGVVYQEEGRIDEAIDCFRRGLELDPAAHIIHSNLLFTLCFKPDADPAAVFAEHRRFDERFAAPLRDPAPHANARDPGRRLRVGYVSPSFNRAAGGVPLLAPIEHHDRDGFEVYCYSVNGFDDEFTERFRRAADHWIDARGWSDEALAQRIREDTIDILVDGAGHMAGNRLLVFARKPAPVQVSFPTYPNTTGLSAMDYRIVDHHFAPASVDAFHSERLIRLPDTHISYEPNDRTAALDAVPPARRNGYVTFGSFNNLAKINAATLALWARLLARIPTAKLMLKWKGLDGREPDWLTARLASAGLDRNRVMLAGWCAGAYEAYRQVDIGLDPLHVNGGTTTCDALWMGVPVVTRYGETPFSRVGLGHLTNVGLPELIAGDDDAYLRIAENLAGDLDRLTDLRRGLRARLAASPLMDAAGYARKLETAYREMWRQWCAGSATALTTRPLRGNLLDNTFRHSARLKS
jgi:predicted O-linked N-acetylglucosamine transferase (SPINDLY family)